MKPLFRDIIHTARQLGEQAQDMFLNVLLPRNCAGCGKANEVFCESCVASSYKNGAQCLICGFRNTDGRICPKCRFGDQVATWRPGRQVQQVLWAGRYDGALKEAIWQFKYRKRKELAGPLAEMLWKKFCEIAFPPTPQKNTRKVRVLQDLAQPDGASREIRQQVNIRVLQNAAPFAVIPIPLHFKKERERSFNQAELLAKEFSKLSNIQCLTNALTKTRETPAQVAVENRELRIKNLEGAFEVRNLEKLGVVPTIILIDDVSTTGATLIHAANALAKTGVVDIVGLVVAHG